MCIFVCKPIIWGQKLQDMRGCVSDFFYLNMKELHRWDKDEKCVFLYADQWCGVKNYKWLTGEVVWVIFLSIRATDVG